MHIQTRISNLEEKIGVNQKPKTIDDLLQDFMDGKYGPVADLFSLIIREHEINPVTSGFPEEVIRYCQDLHAKNKRA